MLAPPFNRIFADLNEAETAFEMLHQTALRLGLTHPYDPRLAVTLSTRALNLDFGGWVVLGFSSGQAMTITLLDLTDSPWQPYKTSTFAHLEEEPPVSSYDLPRPELFPLSVELEHHYQQTLAFIAQKFQGWKRASHWQAHKPEVAEAIFDPAKRARLLTEGLPTPEFLYERQFTHFNVAEEEEGYTVSQRHDLPIQAEYSLDQLMAETYLDRETLTQWLRGLAYKKQIVLYGPPGTGKTFLAQKLARHFMANTNGHLEIIQFHPAYAYEDFIQGLRPQVNAAGQLSYVLQPGRFMLFCERARQAPHAPHVLIIDEMNRANLAQVLGELLYLLEYRHEAIPLAAGGAPLAIPDNLYLIGTMNTADRSIAFVDQALRRRFAFMQVKPNLEVLQAYQAARGYDVTRLSQVLQEINLAIGDTQRELGISFFLVDDLATRLPDIWLMEIEPYLEELFFNRPDDLQKFRWVTINPDLVAPLTQSDS